MLGKCSKTLSLNYFKQMFVSNVLFKSFVWILIWLPMILFWFLIKFFQNYLFFSHIFIVDYQFKRIVITFHAVENMTCKITLKFWKMYILIWKKLLRSYSEFTPILLWKWFLQFWSKHFQFSSTMFRWLWSYFWVE